MPGAALRSALPPPVAPSRLRPPRRPKIRAKIKNSHGKYRARVKKLIKPGGDICAISCTLVQPGVLSPEPQPTNAAPGVVPAIGYVRDQGERVKLGIAVAAPGEHRTECPVQMLA